jgi:hypothetical protein
VGAGGGGGGWVMGGCGWLQMAIGGHRGLLFITTSVPFYGSIHSLFMFLMDPVSSLLAKFLAFRQKEGNYGSHFVKSVEMGEFARHEYNFVSHAYIRPSKIYSYVWRR